MRRIPLALGQLGRGQKTLHLVPAKRVPSLSVDVLHRVHAKGQLGERSPVCMTRGWAIRLGDVVRVHQIRWCEIVVVEKKGSVASVAQGGRSWASPDVMQPAPPEQRAGSEWAAMSIQYYMSLEYVWYYLLMGQSKDIA
jgi:hypothetical protein